MVTYGNEARFTRRGRRDTRCWTMGRFIITKIWQKQQRLAYFVCSITMSVKANQSVESTESSPSHQSQIWERIILQLKVKVIASGSRMVSLRHFESDITRIKVIFSLYNSSHNFLCIIYCIIFFVSFIA